MGLRPYFGASRKLRGFPVSPGMDDGSGVVGGFNPYFDPKYAPGPDFAYGPGAPPGGPHPHFGMHGPPLPHHPNGPFNDFFGPHPPPSAPNGPSGPNPAPVPPNGNPNFTNSTGKALKNLKIRATAAQQSGIYITLPLAE